jgi:NADH:ubiquinone oxidoreductase subunit 2 (subunit N)
MSTRDLFALLPLLLIAASAVVVMLGIAFKRDPALAAGLTLAGLTAAFASIWAAASAVPRQVTPLLLVDGYALFYTGLIVASAGVVTVLAYRYFDTSKATKASARNYISCCCSRLWVARSWWRAAILPPSFLDWNS